ncbi:MAG: hypothetical protein E7505_08875 [Ruminococcus sp.]|nr:hypothetical protein [Ruminococcus sp.]
MTFVIILFALSVIGAIIGFVFRKTLGAVLKLVPLVLIIALIICLAKGIPVFMKVKEYKELAETNITELKKDAEKYAEYVEKAKEINAWVEEYKVKIEEHPAMAFCKDEIEKFEALRLK